MSKSIMKACSVNVIMPGRCKPTECANCGMFEQALKDLLEQKRYEK